MLLTSRYGPLRYSGMAHLLGPVDIRQCRLGDWWLAYVVSPLIDVIDAWLEDAPVVVGGGKWATWRGPTDPVGLSKACGQVPPQLSTGWLVPAPSQAGWRATSVFPSPVWSACTPSSSRCGDLRQELR